MSLYSYLTRLEDTLRSRQDISVENLRLTLTTIGAIFEADLRFYEGSRLLIAEELEEVVAITSRRTVKRNYYKFHYQRADGTLVFRYDCAPLSSLDHVSVSQT